MCQELGRAERAGRFGGAQRGVGFDVPELELDDSLLVRELRALRWADVDFVGERILVRKGVTRNPPRPIAPRTGFRCVGI
ncbi:MAG: hypothetical protein WKF94_06045 [Solirubrobacteraceae bacterium]